MDGLSLRRMTEGDLVAADQLRQVAGWNQTVEDWRHTIRLEPAGCFLALEDGKAVGTVTTTTYGKALAWIGMMLVHPDHRRRGIATTLMQKAVQYLRELGVKCVRLDATPEGYPVYARLGFVSEWTLTRWERAAGSHASLPAASGLDTRELREADWDAVERIDHTAFGTSRSRALRSLLERRRTALVWPAQGPVTGWGLLRPGARADYLGPLGSAASAGAASLAAGLLRAAEQRAVFWDIPDQNEFAKAAAKGFGFAPVRPLTRMRLGSGPSPSEPLSQFAIADPALG